MGRGRRGRGAIREAAAHHNRPNQPGFAGRPLSETTSANAKQPQNDFTMSSTTFFASPNTIMVLSM